MAVELTHALLTFANAYEVRFVNRFVADAAAELFVWMSNGG